MTRSTRAWIVAVIALAASHLAHAEIVSLSAPGETWTLTFDAPPLTPATLPFQPRGYAYFANAGRLNVSFYVEPPACAGGEINAVRLACFKSYKARSPMFVPSSFRATESALGVQVVYGTRAQTGGQLVRQLHVHLLFHRDGKEADFHASIIQPDEKDAAELLALIQSVKVEPK